MSTADRSDGSASWRRRLSSPTLRRRPSPGPPCTRTPDAGDDEAADSGQILLLTIAYAMIALSLVLVIASASAVHIERKQLLALADAAALDAADSIDLDLFYGGGSGPGAGWQPQDASDVAIPLTDSGVRESVAELLAIAPGASHLSGLTILDPTGTPDGTTAQVTLGAVARPPFIPWALIGWSDGIAMRVTSAARAS